MEKFEGPMESRIKTVHQSDSFYILIRGAENVAIQFALPRYSWLESIARDVIGGARQTPTEPPRKRVGEGNLVCEIMANFWYRE